MMLSNLNFINIKAKNARKKNKNSLLAMTSPLHTAVAGRPLRTEPPSPASFQSPEIIDIYESRGSFDYGKGIYTSSTHQRGLSLGSSNEGDPGPSTVALARASISPRVQLDLYSEPLEESIPQEFFQSDSVSFGDILTNLVEEEDIQKTLTETSPMVANGVAVKPGDLNDMLESDASSYSTQEHTAPKKSTPAPIKIPNHNIFGSRLQVQRTASATPATPASSKRLSGLHYLASARAPSRPESPSLSEDQFSAVSGHTLARALIANSFILSSDSRVSRHRSGLTRQDSATLPHGDDPLLNSPYFRSRRISGADTLYSGRSSIVPPVPPLPSDVDVLMMGPKNSKRHSVIITSTAFSPVPAGERSSLRRSSSVGSRSTSDIPPPTISLHRSSSSSRLDTSDMQALRRISRISEAPTPAPSAPPTPQKMLKAERISHVGGDIQRLYQDSEEGNEDTTPQKEKLRGSFGQSLVDTESLFEYDHSPHNRTPDVSTTEDTHEMNPEYPEPSPPFSFTQSMESKQDDVSALLSDYGLRSPPASAARDDALAPPPSATSTQSFYSRAGSISPGTNEERSPSSKKQPRRGKIPIGTSSTDPSGRIQWTPANPRISALYSAAAESSKGRSFSRLPIGERPPSTQSPNSPHTSLLSDARATATGIRMSISQRTSPSASPSPSKRLPVAPAVTASSSSSSLNASQSVESRSSPEKPLHSENTVTETQIKVEEAPAQELEVSEDSTADPSLESPDILDAMLAPAAPRLFSRQRSGSTPDPIQIIREPREARNYDVVNGAQATETSTPSTADSSVHQQFPETPNAFSPLWTNSSGLTSPGMAPRESRLMSIVQQQSGAVISLAQQVMLSRATTVSGLPSRVRPAPAGLSRGLSVEVKHSMGDSLSPIGEERSSDGNSPQQAITPVSAAPRETELEYAREVEVAENVEEMVGDAEGSTSVVVLESAQAVDSTIAEDNKPQSLPGSETLGESATFLEDVNQSVGHSSRPPPVIVPSLVGDYAPATPPPPLLGNDSEPGSAPPRFSSAFPNDDISHQFYGAPPSYQYAIASATHPALGHFRSASGAQTVTMPQLPSSQSSALETPMSPYTGSSSGGQTPMSASASAGRRARSRPPLPVGPRRPSGGQGTSSIGSGPRERNESSASTITHSSSSRNLSNNYHRQNLGTMPSPAPSTPTLRFQTPPPKWRGLTMEAAKWTFTSAQLQAVVSRAIRQSSEASSIRLLQLDTLDNELPEEVHRLDMQHLDIKTKYKQVARRRQALLSALSSLFDGEQNTDPEAVTALVETLTETSTNLDQLTEELHSVTEQMSQLRSLREVHSESALAMALRKLNSSFLSKATENQELRKQLEALEYERDEAWRHAEAMAQEFDELNDKITASLGDKINKPDIARSSQSPRSSHIVALRKSSVRVSRAGLRSSTSQRHHRSSSLSSGGRRGSSGPTSSILDGIVPPVPPMPGQGLGVMTDNLPSRRRSSVYITGSTPSSGTRALAKAQEELYDMLGLPSRRDSDDKLRPRSVSGPVTRESTISSLASPRTRPLSDISTPGYRSSSFPVQVVPGVVDVTGMQSRHSILAALDRSP